jgi:hypothetical protein
MNEIDEIERRLRAQALRPEDAGFTQRVLDALPRRPRVYADVQRSFVLATRGGLALALLVAGLRWYSTNSGDIESLVAFLLFLVPALAATARLSGPLVPSALLRNLWRGARNWR